MSAGDLHCRGFIQWATRDPYAEVRRVARSHCTAPQNLMGCSAPRVTRQSIQDNRAIRWGGRKTERYRESRMKPGDLVIMAPRERQIEEYLPTRKQLPDPVTRRERTQLRAVYNP